MYSVGKLLNSNVVLSGIPFFIVSGTFSQCGLIRGPFGLMHFPLGLHSVLIWIAWPVAVAFFVCRNFNWTTVTEAQDKEDCVLSVNFKVITVFWNNLQSLLYTLTHFIKQKQPLNYHISSFVHHVSLMRSIQFKLIADFPATFFCCEKKRLCFHCVS